jgi:hypothetical protein
MKLNNYLEFITESKLDLLLEANIAFSDNFKKALDDIKSPLSKEIRRIEGDEIDISTNYIEVDFDKDDVVKFIPDNKLKSDDNYTELSNGYLPSKELKRSEIKIGRFIRRLLTKAGVKFTDVDIEEFVNKYKSYIQVNNNAISRFDIVNGKDIKEYYAANRYSKILGTLGSSCMRYPKCQDYLNIYSDNTEVVSLIILRNEEDNSLIDGRALVWVLDDGRKFMDRVYKLEESQDVLFIKYANLNNLHYKRIQNSKEYFDLMLDGALVQEEANIKVNLGDSREYISYPYMDTMKYYNPNDGMLYNNQNVDDVDSCDLLTLEEVNGGDGSCSECGGVGEVECYGCEGSKTQECGDCDGDGEFDCRECDGDGSIKCDDCGGEGYYECGDCDGNGYILEDTDGEYYRCESCNGNGKNECGDCSGDGSNKCDDCNGNGKNECRECSGDGERECSECSGNGTVSCYECS